MTDIFAPPHRDEPRLHVRNLNVSLGLKPILRDVQFHLPLGKTLVVLGESGCGKTTLLRAMAGLMPIQSGELEFDNQRIDFLPPQLRGVVYLDQEPLLFEHLTVAENIGFAMRLGNCPAKEIESSVQGMLQSIDLVKLADRREWQLSGGQRQRVAFARAILARPKVLLLDEPFGSLDFRTRQQMQSLFRTLSQRYQLTSILVTHDVREAIVIGDHFARLNEGHVALYPSRSAFIADPMTGVEAEANFWKRIVEPKSETGQ